MSEAPAMGPVARHGPVLRRALLWLCGLAPFFYLTYGAANSLAAQRASVGNLAFPFESAMPFLAWTIVPYWSINLFYGLSLLVQPNPAAVDRMAQRYLTVQVIAVACFIAFPLTATFTRPQTSGLPGFLFDVLGGFDKPFNQAPSLHIALLVVIWDHWRRLLAPGPRLLWHGWSALIGLSVLTTYQHHLVDIPTGALLGFFALWLVPREGPSPLSRLYRKDDTHPIHRSTTGTRPGRLGRLGRLGLAYGLGALAFLVLSVLGVQLLPPGFEGIALVWLWPALALLIIASAYAGAGPAVFQKDETGQVSLASRVLLAPYRLGARINSWLWTRKRPPCVEIVPGIFLGRYPRRRELADFAAVLDLAGEFVPPPHAGRRWQSVPLLDLVAVPPATVAEAGAAIDQLRTAGPLLICCALGVQRSAGVVAAWLVARRRVTDLAGAEALFAARGWPVRLRPLAGAVPAGVGGMP